MRAAWENIRDLAQLFLWRVREWCGDAAYERYQNAATRKKSSCALTREQFYVEQLERKYSRPSRCC